MSDTPDIVARLRAPAYWMSGSSEGHEGENDAPRKAADTIEDLRRSLKRLRETARKRDETALAFEQQAIRAEKVIEAAREAFHADDRRIRPILFQALTAYDTGETG